MKKMGLRSNFHSSLRRRVISSLASTTSGASFLYLSRANQPHHYYNIAFSRKFTSFSSAPKKKMGMLGWYLGLLESRPIVTKSVTASIIYAAADITSQMITMNSYVSFDTTRMLRMAGFGLLIVGPAQHVWYNFMGRILPKRDTVSTLKKITIGQLFYGPCVNIIFFSFNAALQGENGNEIIARLQRDLLPTLISGLMFWPVCDFLTFKAVPVHLQPLVNSSFSYVWTIYLTYVANLTKAGMD